VCIQLHFTGLSLSNTKPYLERLGVEQGGTAIHDWVLKADIQPSAGTVPNQIALNEIRINDE
jgi:transposase-like protein